MRARSPSSSTAKRTSSRPREKAWSRAACLDRLRRMGSRKNLRGMARFGIRPKRAYGVPKPKMHALAKRIGRSHRLAAALWRSGVHEARLLAGLVEEPPRVTAAQMERWVRAFDNWDLCDGTCGHLFSRTRFAWQKARAWSRRAGEFEKRAGFALMAWLAVHDKQARDRSYLRLLPVIRGALDDPRNYVRKAVSWALRQIGKRNARLNRAAIREAQRIGRRASRTARAIASQALRELTSARLQRRWRPEA